MARNAGVAEGAVSVRIEERGALDGGVWRAAVARLEAPLESDIDTLIQDPAGGSRVLLVVRRDRSCAIAAGGCGGGSAGACRAH